MGFLEGKVALITGGSSGIGLATARAMRAEGARVAIVDLQAPPPGAGDLFMEEDVGDPTSWPLIIARVEESLGGLDVGYLNAGVTTGTAGVEDLTDEQYRRIMRVNVDHVVFGARAIIPALERRGGGDLVATASLAGIVAFPFDTIYTMTKHAVVGLVRSLGQQTEGRGIRVNAVCPGITETPLLKDGEAEHLKAQGFPLIQPEEIAAAVLTAMQSGRSGECWAIQPGRPPEPYKFRGIFGPGVAGAEGKAPEMPGQG